MLDESTFASFYESTKQHLWLYIVRMMRDESRADDIFQETYVRFLQSDVINSGDSQLRSYLYRIATNLMRDHWRKQRREQRWFTDDSNDAPAQGSVADADLQHDIADALGYLAPRQRSMVWLAYVEEYTHKEIAEMLKVRERSVKVLLHRAKLKLLDIFQQKGIAPRATP